MTFDDLLTQICALLQHQGRMSYWALKRRFDLHDDDIEGLKVELIEIQHRAIDQDGKMLVWTGAVGTPPGSPFPPPLEPASSQADRLPQGDAPAAPTAPDAERRQLTVLFCDLGTPRPCPGGSTRRTTAPWCGPTRPRVLR